MEIKTTPIEGILVIQPQIFKDTRGYFLETFHDDRYKQLGIQADFVQDNLSYSIKDVIRGLHFQNPPYEQGKLVSVVKGKVLDVVVDIRVGSSTYGQYFSIELSDENHTQLWIPPGFAHGFSVLSDYAYFSYKCTNFYHQLSEDGIVYNDPDLDIDWKVESPIVSQKDLQLKKLSDIKSLFKI